MNAAHPIEYLTTTRLEIGYKVKGQETAVAETPELSVFPGDFICLLGSNGIGKSTLIRTLAGIQSPLHGSIRIQNQLYDQIMPRERARMISVVLTEPLPIGMMDTYSLVALGRHPHTKWLGLLGKADRDRIEWAFKSVKATGLETRQIIELSDGERQKISIARALAQETPLMLLDEPTAFLDMPRRIELIATLRNLAHQERMGILVSSHELDLALRFADYLWVFTDEGKLVKGHPEELVFNGEIARAFTGEQVKWDAGRGDFQALSESCLKAYLEGSGSYAQWTQRALERFGFCILGKPEGCALHVQVSGADDETQWIVRHGEDENYYKSIGELIDWIRNQDWQH